MIWSYFLDIKVKPTTIFGLCFTCLKALCSHSHIHLALTRPAEEDDARNPAKRIRLDTEEIKQEADVANLQKPQLGFYLEGGDDPCSLNSFNV